MKREISLTYAIKRVKRNAHKYDVVENMLDSIYEYHLRAEDEIPELVKSYNKWAEKNYFDTVTVDEVMRSL